MSSVGVTNYVSQLCIGYGPQSSEIMKKNIVNKSENSLEPHLDPDASKARVPQARFYDLQFKRHVFNF